MSRVTKQKRMLVKRTVGVAKVQRTDERLTLRACSLALALASRNEGVVQLAAEVERERVSRGSWVKMSRRHLWPHVPKK